MGTTVSQITSLAIVYSTVYSGAYQRKLQSSASLVTGEFPAQMASNAENVSIWWRHEFRMIRVINFPYSPGMCVHISIKTSQTAVMRGQLVDVYILRIRI